MVTRNVLAIAPLLLLIGAAEGRAADCLICARQEIPPGAAVTLLRAEGDSVFGFLQMIDPDCSSITLRTRDSPGVDATFHMAGLRAISYVRHGNGNEYVVPFSLVGGIIGGLMGAASHEPPDPRRFDIRISKAAAVILGALGGAAFGAVIGYAVSSDLPHTEVIDCTADSTARRLPPEGEFVFYDVAPVVLVRVPPEYPTAAREAKIEGDVILHVLVGTDGRVWDARVHRGVAGLNDAAANAVKLWRFRAARHGAQLVAVWSEVRIHFPPT